MDVLHYIQTNWAQIGVVYLIIIKVLTAIQDAVDAEPVGLKPPFGRILYYMKALSGYLVAGNRIQPIGGATNATITSGSSNANITVTQTK